MVFYGQNEGACEDVLLCGASEREGATIWDIWALSVYRC